MSEQERKTMLILADTLVGEINIMCVTKDSLEFDTIYGHAKKNLDKLSKIIYDSRFKEDNALPSAQPEIIQCKDCKFWRTSTYINGKFKFLPKCGFNQIYVDGEDFCSRAERRDPIDPTSFRIPTETEDAISETLKLCGISGEDASMMFIEVMKKLGKNNNIPICCGSRTER